MYTLSNEDFTRAMRLLLSFANSKGKTRRENEDRRQAHLLYRKLKKRAEKAAQSSSVITNQAKTR